MENKFDALNEEEQLIANMIANDEFITNDTDENFWKNAVRETTKRKSVHLKLQEKDVQKIRTIAYKKGIPYQTLIGSIIHQYAQSYS